MSERGQISIFKGVWGFLAMESPKFRGPPPIGEH